MTLEKFRELIKPIAAAICGKEVGDELERQLNTRFPESSDTFARIERACHEAIEEGWMCSQGEGNRKFGRVLEADEAMYCVSVDVVDLTDIVGPHHRHPKGEICMIMPVSAEARFDGRGAGWKVYPPDSAHRPTVTDGRALVLYFLPEGAIEFTGE